MRTYVCDARGHRYAEFQRALKNGNVWSLKLSHASCPRSRSALRLVHLYAQKESPKFERAAVKWLRQYLNETSPELSDVAKVAAEIVERRETPYN
jgi:hypothetical protein